MKTGLMLVDIQNDYFAGGRMELVGMEAASATARKLLDFFRERQWPTFHIQHVAIREGATFFLPDKSSDFINSISPPPRHLTAVGGPRTKSTSEAKVGGGVLDCFQMFGSC